MTKDKMFKRLIRTRAASTGLSYAATRHRLLRDPQRGEGMPEQLIEVELNDVVFGGEQRTPTMQLAESGGARHLDIFIGQPHATAILAALQPVDTARPMTHDMLTSTVRALD